MMMEMAARDWIPEFQESDIWFHWPTFGDACPVPAGIPLMRIMNGEGAAGYQLETQKEKT